MAFVLILVLLATVPTFSEGTSEKAGTPEKHLVSSETVASSISDKKDAFENTRETKICIYAQDRSLFTAAAQYTQEGKFELATVTLDMISKLPPRISSDIHLIRFQTNGETRYFLQFSTSSPSRPFELAEAKALADKQLIEFRLGEIDQEARESSKGIFYNYRHLAEVTPDTMATITSADALQFKFYSSDDRSFIEELDLNDMQYAKYFGEYLKGK